MERTLFATLIALIIPLSSFAAFAKDLRFGSRGSEVTLLQQFLTDQKVYLGPITGYFGLLTKKGVQAFQLREKITPRSGFVGPLTRARISQILAAASSTPPVVALPPVATSTATTTADVTPPSFVTGPSAALSAPVLAGPFGIQAPYQIVFNWGTNEPAALIGFSCDPGVLQSGIGAAATYWSGIAGRRVCTITVQDPAGNRTSQDFAFVVPDLIVVQGGRTIPFAEQLYLGDLTIRNNSTSTITLFQVKLSMEEALNAPNSRGKKIDIFMRNGTTTAAELLAHENITLRTSFPRAGEVNTDSVSLYSGKVFAPGAEQTYGIWVESLGGPSFGGYIKFTVSSIVAIPDTAVAGTPVYTIQ